jgi:hypothetical protein
VSHPGRFVAEAGLAPCRPSKRAWRLSAVFGGPLAQFARASGSAARTSSASPASASAFNFQVRQLIEGADRLPVARGALSREIFQGLSGNAGRKSVIILPVRKKSILPEDLGVERSRWSSAPRRAARIRT